MNNPEALGRDGFLVEMMLSVLSFSLSPSLSELYSHHVGSIPRLHTMSSWQLQFPSHLLVQQKGYIPHSPTKLREVPNLRLLVLLILNQL